VYLIQTVVKMQSFHVNEGQTDSIHCALKGHAISMGSTSWYETHSCILYFTLFSEQTLFTSLYSTHWLVFSVETRNV